ncbi:MULTISPECIES: polyamine ABC transporter substrate-binding protein [unclassified Vibrio]|uniref:polyamine ABC transporter substrate-binding protein n=1 Tax=unclassified Vibrio TaxID=2614977 RepID=UPI000B8E23FB|nr:MULTISPECIES: spermidine/putrescine ABC transporter substrate-binding protein [unclassified Vibrio]NAW90740.1 extracellular solute-binding protein [Vibrio sp. V24_P1S3T111]OXX19419.1 Norspermidine sensor [Vibrio sp. V05_P4A8T149]OXX26181.1 Norspermidine sensor [Vibrio sp. V06_P1A73T115]OXX31060.1 Norspermidine sensor [Vibrio sp. V04_P4A5T148]OXX35746.1 Norspermidine sensor [Vibrio sp. V14_P6S14T42]
MMKIHPLALMLFLLGISAHIRSSELNIYLWEDTMSPQIVDQWRQSSGIDINLYHFDNDDERSLLMVKSVQLPFDIVVLDNVSALIYSRLNTFEDLRALPNRKHNDTKWNQACGSHAVPYFWGTVGIVYKKSKFPAKPKNWADLIDMPPALQGHVGMLHDTVETLLPALYAQQQSPVTNHDNALKQAYQKMLSVNRNILTYEYILSYVRSHPDSDGLDMALAYSGDQFSLNKYFGSNDWDFVTPQGRPYIWVDCLAINSNSKNKEHAKEFINHLLSPEVAAINAKDIKAATPNLSALNLMPDSYRNDASLFPNPALLEQGIIDSELLPADISLRAKIINSILEQHEAQQ